MQTICWEADQDPVPKYIDFVSNDVNVVYGFVSYVLSVQNHFFLTALRKLVMSEGFVSEIQLSV